MQMVKITALLLPVLFAIIQVACTRSAPTSAVVFHLTGEKCSNGKADGFNPNYLGECGDVYAKTFRGLDLSDQNFSGFNAPESTFYGLAFDHGQAQFSHFAGAHFIESSLTFADFSHSRLAGLQSSYSDWSGAIFVGADLRAAKFHLDVMRDCDFRGADLTGAILIATTLRGSRFDQATKLPFSHDEALAFGMIYVP